MRLSNIRRMRPAHSESYKEAVTQKTEKEAGANVFKSLITRNLPRTEENRNK